MTTLYTTSATATAGRNGQVSTDDNLLSVALSYPKEMGGTGEATNLSNCLLRATLRVSQMLYFTLRKR